MAVTPRVVQAQLERAVGGADQLKMLVDKNGTGNLSDATCQAFIAEVLSEGNGDVNGYVELAADITDPGVQAAPMLVRYELAVDVYLLWHKSTGGIAIPDKVQAEYDRVLGELEKIGARKKGIGVAPRPAAGQVVVEVTKDQSSDDWVNPLSPRRWFDGFS
jgi:Protein of unknown function (DUF1320)